MILFFQYMNYPRVPKNRILLNFVDAALLHFYGEPWRRGNKTNNFVGISASDMLLWKVRLQCGIKKKCFLSRQWIQLITSRKKFGDEGGFGHSAFRRVVSPKQNTFQAGEQYGFAECRDGLRRRWSSIVLIPLIYCQLGDFMPPTTF